MLLGYMIVMLHQVCGFESLVLSAAGSKNPTFYDCLMIFAETIKTPFILEKGRIKMMKLSTI